MSSLFVGESSSSNLMISYPSNSNEQENKEKKNSDDHWFSKSNEQNKNFIFHDFDSIESSNGNFNREEKAALNEKKEHNEMI